MVQEDQKDNKNTIVNEAVTPFPVNVNHLRTHTISMLNDITDVQVLQRVCQYIVYVSDKNNKSKTSELSTLEQKIQQLQKKDYYDDQNLRPSDNVVANTLLFIRQSKDKKILEKATPFVRTNGTYLIKWRTDNVLASLNIGNEEFTYSVIPSGQDLSKAIVGRHSITDSMAVSYFYTLIK